MLMFAIKLCTDLNRLVAHIRIYTWFRLFFVDNDENNPSYHHSSAVRSWIGVIALILSVIMIEPASDSFTGGCPIHNRHISLTRAVMVTLTICQVVVVLTIQYLSSLHLFCNMLTACCLPVISGLFKINNCYISETSALFGCMCGITLSTACGAGRWRYALHSPLMGKQFGSENEAMAFGVYYTWLGNINYEWDYFVVACCTSVGGMMLWSACSSGSKRPFYEFVTEAKTLETNPSQAEAKLD